VPGHGRAETVRGTDARQPTFIPFLRRGQRLPCFEKVTEYPESASLISSLLLLSCLFCFIIVDFVEMDFYGLVVSILLVIFINSLRISAQQHVNRLRKAAIYF